MIPSVHTPDFQKVANLFQKDFRVPSTDEDLRDATIDGTFTVGPEGVTFQGHLSYWGGQTKYNLELVSVKSQVGTVAGAFTSAWVRVPKDLENKEFEVNSEGFMFTGGISFPFVKAGVVALAAAAPLNWKLRCIVKLVKA